MCVLYPTYFAGLQFFLIQNSTKVLVVCIVVLTLATILTFLALMVKIQGQVQLEIRWDRKGPTIPDFDTSA
jgi:uncharacterized protein YybS (DUF2232 family)